MFDSISGRLIQHQHERKFSFNTPTFRHSASSGKHIFFFFFYSISEILNIYQCFHQIVSPCLGPTTLVFVVFIQLSFVFYLAFDY